MVLAGSAVTFNLGEIRDKWLNYPSRKDDGNADNGAEIGNLAISIVGFGLLGFGVIFTLAGLVNAL
jgi:hypothetical protein